MIDDKTFSGLGFTQKYKGTWVRPLNVIKVSYDIKTEVLCTYGQRDNKDYLVVELVQTHGKHKKPHFNKFTKFSGVVDKSEDFEYLIKLLKL